MTDRLDGVDEVPVLLAGGGLVGLSTAMFLAQHGVASLAVEPLRGGSQLPRAAFFHMRTLELFRAAGIEDEVRRQSLREFEPEGAIVMVQTLAGSNVAAIITSLNDGVDALSPCHRLFVTQPGLEPILRARAERAGARVLEGTASVRSGVRRDRRSRRRGLGRRRAVGGARRRRPRARGPRRRPRRPERSRGAVRGGLRADLVRRCPGAPGWLCAGRTAGMADDPVRALSSALTRVLMR